MAAAIFLLPRLVAVPVKLATTIRFICASYSGKWHFGFKLHFNDRFFIRFRFFFVFVLFLVLYLFAQFSFICLETQRSHGRLRQLNQKCNDSNNRSDNRSGNNAACVKACEGWGLLLYTQCVGLWPRWFPVVSVWFATNFSAICRA